MTDATSPDATASGSHVEDILDILDSDHHAFGRQLDRARTTTGRDELEALCEQLVMDVVRHFVAEEQYLLPLVRERLTDGEEHSRAAFAEHRQVEDTLRRLEQVDRDPQAVQDVLGDVAAGLRAHAARQHDALFPALRSAARPGELASLADDVLGAEQLAPTRPRELRPESPALNKAVSFVAGWIDHARDYYERRGVEPEGQR